MPDEPKKGMDRLTSQLYYIPGIIGKMGISIAEAQTMLNADYVRTLTQLMVLFKNSSDGKPGETAPAAPDWALFSEILKQVAPSRYQFTESTIEFSADLSESLNIAGGVGVGLGMAGVTVNASLSMGYARDYRAAARITSVLHAIPANEAFGNTLLNRAAAITDSNLPLPSKAVVDKALWDEVAAQRKALTGKSAPDVKKFVLDVPSDVALKIGASVDIKIGIKRADDFKGEVTITLSGLPANVTGPANNAITVPADKSEGTLKLDAAAGAQAKTSAVKFEGKSPDAPTVSGEFQLTVA